MISIQIPQELIPEDCKYRVDVPIYRNGEFIRMSEQLIVPLTDEHTLTDHLCDEEFFIELSGNEFNKLIERDELPSWATPYLLFHYSTALGYVNPNTRKITWMRKNRFQHFIHTFQQSTHQLAY
jgi:hypothetical protein